MSFTRGEAKELLRKVLVALTKSYKEKGKAWELYADLSFDRDNPKKGIITLQGIENAAGNHLFDDHPEEFGIEEIEGYGVRENCQMLSQAHPTIGDHFTREEATEIIKGFQPG